jgi:hypothetical protein
MYESGHSSSAADLREALAKLEVAVAQQKVRLRAAAADAAAEGVLVALRKSVWMMEQEALRLQQMLERD